jgi:hypothetical protein
VRRVRLKSVWVEVGEDVIIGASKEEVNPLKKSFH